MKFPCLFDIVIYDSLAETETYNRHSGILFADSYADAAHILEEDYGDELISIKHLELLEKTNEIYLPWEILNNIRSDTYWKGISCDGDGNLA